MRKTVNQHWQGHPNCQQTQQVSCTVRAQPKKHGLMIPMSLLQSKGLVDLTGFNAFAVMGTVVAPTCPPKSETGAAG